MSADKQAINITRIAACHWQRNAKRAEIYSVEAVLTLIIKALDGETDPAELVVSGEDADWIRRMTEPTFEAVPTAWWCLAHDHPARNGAECVWGHLGPCRLAPVYIRTEDIT